MPEIYAYACSSCGFSAASDLSGGMYAIDDEGTWVACLHPGEFTTAAEVLGLSLEELGQALGRRRVASEDEAHAQPPDRTTWVAAKCHEGSIRQMGTGIHM